MGIILSVHIGQGMFADVYLGRYKGRKVAVKVTNNDKCNPRTLEAEMEVTDLLKDIRHQNIIKFFDIFRDVSPTQTWFLMLYFEGQDMKEVLKMQKKAFSESVAKLYFR